MCGAKPSSPRGGFSREFHPTSGSSRVINQSHGAANCISLAVLPISPTLVLCTALLYHRSAGPGLTPTPGPGPQSLLEIRIISSIGLGEAFILAPSNEPVATWCGPRALNGVTAGLQGGAGCGASSGERYKGPSRVPETGSLGHSGGSCFLSAVLRKTSPRP